MRVPPNLIRLTVAALFAALGGWLASRLQFPLAWLVGAMIVTAALTLGGLQVDMPRPLYRTGQIVIAVSVGLSVSSDVGTIVVPHIPLIVSGALISIAIGYFLSGLLARWSRLDRASAHFSMIPAGISEMGDLAGRMGADVGAVATFHTLRVTLIVIVLPAVMFLLFEHGDRLPQAVAGRYDAQLALAFAAGVAAALAGSAIGMPAAFFVAPMLVLSLLSGSGLIEARTPHEVLAVAQVMLGLALGARFRRETMARLPCALAIGMILILVHAFAMGAIAVAASAVMGQEVRLLILGLATGGTAEMVLTAKMVGANAALVAAYQVTRGLLGNLLAQPIYRLAIARRSL